MIDEQYCIRNGVSSYAISIAAAGDPAPVTVPSNYGFIFINPFVS
jgi:hypothetical protein